MESQQQLLIGVLAALLKDGKEVFVADEDAYTWDSQGAQIHIIRDEARNGWTVKRTPGIVEGEVVDGD